MEVVRIDITSGDGSVNAKGIAVIFVGRQDVDLDNVKVSSKEGWENGEESLCLHHLIVDSKIYVKSFEGKRGVQIWTNDDDRTKLCDTGGDIESAMSLMNRFLCEVL